MGLIAGTLLFGLSTDGSPVSQSYALGPAQQEETAQPEETPTPGPTPTSAQTATPERPAGSEGGDGDGGFPTWGWIVIVAVAVLIVVVLFSAVRGAARASAARQSSWNAAVLDGYGKGVSLHDALVADAMVGTIAVEDTERRWSNAQRRIDDLAADLHTLSARAPDVDSNNAVRETTVALTTLRSAVQSHLSIIGGDMTPSDAQVEESESTLRRRLSEFQATLNVLRARA